MERATTKVAGGLSAKRRRFVCEYLVDQNATRAAIRAGYSRKTARAIGSRLLTKVDIRRAIALRLEKQEVTADRVLAELAKIAFANMADYLTIGPDGSARIDSSKVTRDEFAGIRELKICPGANGRKPSGLRLSLRHKVRALDLLGRYFGLFSGRNQPGWADEMAETLHKGRLRVAGLLNDGADAVPG
jgi:phage terminase small subunit